MEGNHVFVTVVLYCEDDTFMSSIFIPYRWGESQAAPIIPSEKHKPGDARNASRALQGL